MADIPANLIENIHSNLQTYYVNSLIGQKIRQTTRLSSSQETLANLSRPQKSHQSSSQQLSFISFVVFYGPVGFSNDTRLFMPFKMVLKVFKERDIARYLFHEFFPFCQNFYLVWLALQASLLTLFSSESNSLPKASISGVNFFLITKS